MQTQPCSKGTKSERICALVRYYPQREISIHYAAPDGGGWKRQKMMLQEGVLAYRQEGTKV